MKRLVSAALAVSLLVNLALAALLFIGLGTPPEPPAPALAATAAKAQAAGPVLDATFWPGLQGDDAGDLRGLVARLRAAGFPPAIVRAIVAAQLSESYAARRRALDPEAANRPFWKRAQPNAAVEAALRQLSREQQKALRELLGPDAEPDDPMSRYYMDRRVAGVPAAKVETVREIIREFDERRSELYSTVAGGSMMNSEKLNALEKQLREAVARVLTPQEYEDWQLRSSDTAQNLRGRLTFFEPTEQEFRTIFALRREFDDRFGQFYATPTQAEMRARAEAEQQMNTQIKAALGPVRGADYERTTDYQYTQASQLLNRLQLPAENAQKIYALQKDVQQQLQEIYRTPNLPAAERNDRLAQLNNQALTQLAPLLGGDRGVAAYRQNGGFWLDQLNPPRPPSPPPAAATPTPAPAPAPAK